MYNYVHILQRVKKYIGRSASLRIIVGAYLAFSCPRADASDLFVERIFGDRPLLAPLPKHIVWQGNSRGISYLLSEDRDGTSQTAFVLQEVPSGRMKTICIPDTAIVPEDLRDGATPLAIDTYRWDSDGRMVVFSFAGELFTLEAKSGKIVRRTFEPGAEMDAEFSPDGELLAFSRDNDLFVLEIDSGEETRLTTTGSNTVYNGTLDWVYMEELFTRGDVKAFSWSPDGSRIAFLEIREHPVPEFPLVDLREVKPSWELQHYPQPGDPIPIVRVGMVRVSGGDVVWADTDTGDDSYIARMYWLGDSHSVAIEKLNRAQTDVHLFFANSSNGRLEEVLEESDDAWVNVNYLKHYYRKKRQFIWGSERDGHSHLYLYNLDGSLIRQVTVGEWEVIDLVGVNESKGRIYFRANEKDVLERHLYEIDENGKKLRRITRSEGDHKVTMSPDNKYFIDSHSSHSEPPRITVNEVKGKELFLVAEQSTEEFRAANRPIPEFLTIDAGGNTFHCSITRPLDFDPGHKYPVITFVYGGPHSQYARKFWTRNNLWHSLMASRGYIVFSMDNRGTAGRGSSWEIPLLRNLGAIELEDQLAGVDYLKSLPYVDPERMGIWGWSYGGYMTLMAMLKAPGVFRAGVSVAPVTDWRLYDSIYTERYMKLPADNEQGYYDSSPLNFAGDLEGNLLLMHGDADDNVHMQNSIRMIRALIDAGKDFDLMIYPGKLHGITGSVDRTHLYGKMTRFFDRHLMMQNESDTPSP